MSEPVEVYTWRPDDGDVLVGRLWGHRGRGTESASFAYDDTWIARPDAHPLEPALPLVSGTFQTARGRTLFGAFADSAPDGWGRAVIRRRESRRARAAGEAGRSFDDLTYLLGARDDLRQGALRFARPGERAFLAPPGSGVPSLIQLPALLGAVDRFERDSGDDADLALLLAAGSSLGGARPKAHVLTASAVLAIAKFPSARRDDWDVIAWEKTALDIARAAGLRVPPCELITVGGRRVLIIERFDRRGDERIGYLSAMTMLEARDGDTHSYLEIADAISAESSHVGEDLTELWSRMVLSVLVSNTDDHLRNHGFVRDGRAGWRLSPVFDVNPNPEPGNAEHSTAIDGDDTHATIAAAVEVAPYFRLGADDALSILRRVESAVAGWRQAARRNGLDADALERLAPAFEHEQRTEAVRILAA